MLWSIVAVLLILWLLGFSLHLAGRSDSPAIGCSVRDDRHQSD
jgi:hypothetical protein